MIKAYICHPYSDDPQGNIERVSKICAAIAKDSVSHMKEELNYVDQVGDLYNSYNDYSHKDLVVVPIAPHLLFPKFMSEDGGISRDAALAFCFGLLSTCNELWVCSDNITDGMKWEIEYASLWGKRVVFWDGEIVESSSSSPVGQFGFHVEDWE